MAVADASKWFTRQGGEPATAFISGSDGVAAVTQTYTDFEAADALLAPLASPTFTGVPAAPTAAVDTNTTQVATTAYVVGQAVAKSAVGNLLTANQASIETDTTGFNNPSSCTLARSTTAGTFLAGSASLAATCSSTAFAFFTPLAASGVPVTPGLTYHAQVSAKAGTNPANLYVAIRFYNGAASLGDSAGSDMAVTTSAWATLRATFVAPATATHATVFVASGSGGVTASDVYYFDEFGFWQGAGGQWALPGTPITNQGFYTDESCGRRLFQWDANNSRFQQTYGDTGWRNVTSLVTPPANLTITTIYVRRINSTVYVRVNSQAAAGIAATVWSWATIGTGFTPVDIASHLFYYYRSFTDSERQLWYRDNITADIGTSAANPSPLDVSWIHVTSDAWPTTLPGSAVGSIPA